MNNVLGNNLLRIRHSEGLTQEEVAKRAGTSLGAYRNAERSKSMPRVDTLQSIAEALNVSIQDLVTPAPTLSAVRFRARKKIRSREEVLVKVAHRLQDFNELEDIVDEHIPCCLDAIAGELEALADRSPLPISAAKAARNVFGLGTEEAIWNICGLLESHGVKVLQLKFATYGFFGLSVAEKDGRPAVAVNVWERIPVERWIFSAAHEFGHLLLHLDAYDVGQESEDRREEEEANLFAAHFLMPQQAFQTEWQSTSGLDLINRVIKVKRIFRVSYKTVLARLVETDIVDKSIWAKFNSYYARRHGRTLSGKEEPQAIESPAFGSSMSEAFSANEPDKLVPADFLEDRLSRLVRIAIERELITMSRGAEILRIGLNEMKERAASWVGAAC